MKRRLFTGFALLAAALSVGSAAAAHPRSNQVSAGVSAYSRGDYVRAAALLLPPANLGDSIAETYVGFMYQYGRGVPQDYAESARWFRSAAEQGEPAAQFFLGELYDRGLGAPHDFVEAEFWLDLAAAHAPSRVRNYWTNMRDDVAGKLSHDELRRAQTRALAFNARPDF